MKGKPMGDGVAMSDLMAEIRHIRDDVQELREELHRYKGFVGGVVWCFSALAATVGFVWGAISGTGF